MSNSTSVSENEVSGTGDSPNAVSPTAIATKKSMPVWFIAGIFGVLIGGVGGFLLAKYGYGHQVKIIRMPADAGESYGKPLVTDAASEQKGTGGD